MVLSNKGLELIKGFEGFRSRPYLDQAAVPTIGYGTTHYHHRAVRMSDGRISQQEATYLMRAQIDAIYGKAVNHAVQVPINQDQFDALVSFTYNEGVGALRTSTLLKKLNKGKKLQADKEFAKWNRANGKVNKGLTRRRRLEAALFIGELDGNT